jgi:hypothetical protein
MLAAPSDSVGWVWHDHRVYVEDGGCDPTPICFKLAEMAELAEPHKNRQMVKKEMAETDKRDGG